MMKSGILWIKDSTELAVRFSCDFELFHYIVVNNFPECFTMKVGTVSLPVHKTVVLFHSCNLVKPIR